jgi:pilus assembly protein CpaD
MNAKLPVAVLALGLTVLVGGCETPASYTAAEAPKTIVLDSAASEFDVRFVPRSATLAAADAARLRQLAASGVIAPADRVLVATAGPPALAAQRHAAISSLLLHYGIVTIADRLAHVRPESAAIQVTRTLVTLPACPNWSKPSNYDFGNQPSSNFGCATQVNFGKMVAHPTDIASGLPASGASGKPAAAAVNRYMNDKVTPLPESGKASAFSSAGGTATGNAPSTGSQ